MSRTAHRFHRHARVTWPACHVVLSFRPLRPFSRDAFTTISRSKLTATSSVLGYNSLERQVCQRPSYSVHARSVEGHYRLLSGCNRPRASVHACSRREASKRISDFVCATVSNLLASATVKADGKFSVEFFFSFLLTVFRFLNTRYVIYMEIMDCAGYYMKDLFCFFFLVWLGEIS